MTLWRLPCSGAASRYPIRDSTGRSCSASKGWIRHPEAPHAKAAQGKVRIILKEQPHNRDIGRGLRQARKQGESLVPIGADVEKADLRERATRRGKARFQVMKGRHVNHMHQAGFPCQQGFQLGGQAPVGGHEPSVPAGRSSGPARRRRWGWVPQVLASIELDRQPGQKV